MATFKALIKWIADSYTARDMRSRLWNAGLGLNWYDADHLCKYYLKGESAEFVLQAALSIQQIGE